MATRGDPPGRPHPAPAQVLFPSPGLLSLCRKRVRLLSNPFLISWFLRCFANGSFSKSRLSLPQTRHAFLGCPCAGGRRRLWADPLVWDATAVRAAVPPGPLAQQASSEGSGSRRLGPFSLSHGSCVACMGGWLALACCGPGSSLAWPPGLTHSASGPALLGGCTECHISPRAWKRWATCPRRSFSGCLVISTPACPCVLSPWMVHPLFAPAVSSSGLFCPCSLSPWWPHLSPAQSHQHPESASTCVLLSAATSVLWLVSGHGQGHSPGRLARLVFLVRPRHGVRMLPPPSQRDAVTPGRPQGHPPARAAPWLGGGPAGGHTDPRPLCSLRAAVQLLSPPPSLPGQCWPQPGNPHCPLGRGSPAIHLDGLSQGWPPGQPLDRRASVLTLATCARWDQPWEGGHLRRCPWI